MTIRPHQDQGLFVKRGDGRVGYGLNAQRHAARRGGLDDRANLGRFWPKSHEDESVDLTMEKMTVRRCRHLPVVFNERLVGIVSIGDVVKYRLEQLEHEHRAMREYIATA